MPNGTKPMPADFPRPVLAFIAYSGTGKTTLLEQLLPLLCEAGLRVSYIKHSHHRVDLDQPGKDSYRLREAGASQVMLATAKRWVLMQENPQHTDEPELATLLEQLDPTRCDLVLVEGFKHAHIPKIECLRQGHLEQIGRLPRYPDDPDIIAIASDTPVLPARPLPVLDLNQPGQIRQFILDWLPQHQKTKEPT